MGDASVMRDSHNSQSSDSLDQAIDNFGERGNSKQTLDSYESDDLSILEVACLVAGLLGVLLLAGVLFLCWRERKSRKDHQISKVEQGGERTDLGKKTSFVYVDLSRSPSRLPAPLTTQNIAEHV